MSSSIVCLISDSVEAGEGAAVWRLLTLSPGEACKGSVVAGLVLSSSNLAHVCAAATNLDPSGSESGLNLGCRSLLALPLDMKCLPGGSPRGVAVYRPSSPRQLRGAPISQVGAELQA